MRIDSSTALRFTTGRVPGRPRHTGCTLVLGSPAETVGGRREHLRLGGQLGVDLEPDHHFPAIGKQVGFVAELSGCGRRGAMHGAGSVDGLSHGAIPSSAAATRYITGSPSMGASTCTPTGRPWAPVPKGTDIAGWPVRFDGMVQTSL